MVDVFFHSMPWIAVSLFVTAAAHVLLLIFFSMRRARRDERPLPEAAPHAPQMADPATSAEIERLRALCAELEEKNKERSQAEAQRKMLLARVRALEAKIQEYEILQEELGALTELKVENARLKEELGQLEEERPPDPPAAPPEPLRVIKATEPTPEPPAADPALDTLLAEINASMASHKQ